MDASLSEIAATLAHEVRNPLALAMVNINILELSNKSPRDAKRFESVRRELAKIGDIMYSLADLTIPAANGNETTLSALAKDILGPYIETYAGKISFNVQIPEIIIPIPPEPLKIILNNIIKNAVEAVLAIQSAAAPKNPASISISAYIKNSLAILSIKDNGIGMDKEALRNAFKPRFTTKGDGTGIGLFAARLLAGKYGGEIWIESEAGEGCTVELRVGLPT